MPSIERFLDLLSEEMAGLSIEVEPCIITNGTVFNDRLARLLRRTRCSVNISLDGYGPYHDIYRVYKGKGGGSWAEIHRNITAFLAEDVLVNVNTTITPSAPSLPDLLRWAVVERGIRHVRLGIIHNLVGSSWDRGVHEQSRWDVQLQRLRDGFEGLSKFLEDPGIQLDLRTTLLIQDLAFNRPHPSICCGIGWNHIVIRHDGQLASCPMTVGECSYAVADDLFESNKQTFPYDPRELVDAECKRCQWYNVWRAPVR